MKFNIAFVGLSALVGTALTKENTLSIKWCNEDDELDGPCITHPVPALKQCDLIPDSNAKGDYGSSFQIVDSTDHDYMIYCNMWKSNNCTGHSWGVEGGFNYRGHVIDEADKNGAPYRSYKCVQQKYSV